MTLNPPLLAIKNWRFRNLLWFNILKSFYSTILWGILGVFQLRYTANYNYQYHSVLDVLTFLDQLDYWHVSIFLSYSWRNSSSQDSRHCQQQWILHKKMNRLKQLKRHKYDFQDLWIAFHAVKEWSYSIFFLETSFRFEHHTASWIPFLYLLDFFFLRLCNVSKLHYQQLLFS